MTLRHVVKDIKSEALEKFVAELMTELLEQGFIHADALNALATWSSGQMPDEVVKKLEFFACSVEER